VAKLNVELVTAEGRLLSQEADFVRAPGLGGELGILPQHIPLLTPLTTGEVKVVNDGHEVLIFVAGGFLEVLPDKVVILADDAEKAEDVDASRAEEARRAAQDALASNENNAEAAAELEKAMFRLKVADIRRRHRERPQRPG